ncbi:Uncharacterised protein [Salmonella enterica subsp. houtenae]|nr:Uncharacterised protein [Salmonella enterica subsp. houtenae]
MGVLRFVIMSSDINQIIQEALSQNCTTTIVLGSTSKVNKRRSQSYV